MNSETGNFDRLAGIYDFLARLVFGNRLLKAQQAWQNRIPPNAEVLFIGGGTGRVLEDLIQTSKPKKIVYVEASKKMIDLARSRIQEKEGSPEIVWIHGTEKEIPQDHQFDAILTYFYLDLFSDSDLKPIMALLGRYLRTNGIWLVADFGYASKGGRILSGWMIRLMYTFFGLTTGMKNRSLPDIEKAFHGYFLLDKTDWLGGLINSWCWKKIRLDP